MSQSRGGSKRLGFILCLALFVNATSLFAQKVLTADGQTDAYTRIKSVLASSPETHDCSHPDFGPHITQAIDDDANFNKYVFVFNIHVTPDNDRCSAFDRQRLEIKTEGNASTPDALKGFLGDSVTFRWDFKLPAGFQPSTAFTHIHQIKAFDGDSGAPLMTLTPRKANPNRLELIFIDSKGVTTKLASTPLAPFVGQWVEGYEKITYGHNGQYSIVLKSVTDGTTLFTYSNNDLDLWRTGTTVVRPKWGIYRSLNDAVDMRDEQVRFDRFCLAKGSIDCVSDQDSPEFSLAVTPPSGSTGAGGTASFQVEASALRGFTGDIALSVTGLPQGATTQFSPPVISGGSGPATLTITTLPNTSAGQYSPVIEGVSGVLSHVVSSALNIEVDSTPPVSTAFLSPGPNINGWNNSDVIVTLNSSDNETAGTGVKQIAYSANGAQTIGNTVISAASTSFAVNTEGMTAVTFFGTDNAGNVEATKAAAIRLDKTPPTIAGLRTPGPNANGWNNTSVTVAFQCADALSGLASGSPPSPTVVGTEGANQSVSGLCADLAGNPASTAVSGINIDKTPPALVAMLSPLQNANGWNNTDVTITFNTADALSGVASVTPPVLVQMEGTNQAFTGVAAGFAGNVISLPVSVSLDKTPPEAFNQFDATAHDVVLIGRDALSGTAPGPITATSVVQLSKHDDDDDHGPGRDSKDRDGGDLDNKDKDRRDGDRDDVTVELRTYTILDLAGNTLVLTERVRKAEHSITVHIVSLQYGSGPVLTPPRNKQCFEWETGRGGNLRELVQQLQVGTEKHGQEVSAHFDAEDNQTVIRDAFKRGRIVKPGLMLLQMATDNGMLALQF